MRDLSIIIAFMAIVLVACAPKEKDCEKDADSAKTADGTELPQDATQTKAEDATLLDPALEDNEPDEDREQFRHFTDPNVDSLYTGAGTGYE